MTRSRIVALAAVVLTGAMLSVPAVGASGSAAPGDQKFVMIQTDPREEGGPIAATGPIHAKGVDVVTGEFKDRFEFPDGNVIIRHKPEGIGTDSFDPATCLFTFTERGSWKTVRGTGAYANVQGSGTYRVFAQGFGCDENRPPETFFVRIVAKGPLAY